MSGDAIELEGTVTDILGWGKYKVMIDDMDLEVTCYAAWKMKKFNIRIIPGDIVTVELSPYEPTQWRITYRKINKEVGRKKRPPAPQRSEAPQRAPALKKPSSEDKKVE